MLASIDGSDSSTRGGKPEWFSRHTASGPVAGVEVAGTGVAAESTSTGERSAGLEGSSFGAGRVAGSEPLAATVAAAAGDGSKSNVKGGPSPWGCAGARDAVTDSFAGARGACADA